MTLPVFGTTASIAVDETTLKEAPIFPKETPFTRSKFLPSIRMVAPGAADAGTMPVIWVGPAGGGAVVVTAAAGAPATTVTVAYSSDPPAGFVATTVSAPSGTPDGTVSCKRRGVESVNAAGNDVVPDLRTTLLTFSRLKPSTASVVPTVAVDGDTVVIRGRTINCEAPLPV